MKNRVKGLFLGALALTALSPVALASTTEGAFLSKSTSLLEINKEVSILSESSEFQNISSIKDANLTILTIQLNEMMISNAYLRHQIENQSRQLSLEKIMADSLTIIKNSLTQLERRG